MKAPESRWGERPITQAMRSRKLQLVIVLLTILTGHCSSQESLTVVSKDGCAKTKGCYSDPESCSSSTDCDYLVTFQHIPGNDSVLFELSCKSDWAAIGFNGQRDMDGTDAIICSKQTSGTILIGHYAVHQHDTPDITAKRPAGLFDMSGVHRDGTLLCRFNRAEKDPAMAADLTKEWYLISALGPVNGGLRKHTKMAASDKKVNFTGFQALGAPEGGGALIRAHAALMVLAWLGFATVAIFLARYTREIWEEKTILGQKVWFQVHRGLMVMAVFFTVLAVILAFVHSDGWSEGAGAHPTVGIIVLVLAATQPVMAIIRPHPGEPRRVIFNWVHRSVGLTALLLAVVNVFLGADLAAVDLEDAGVYVMLFYCLAIVVVLGLEVYLYLNRSQDGLSDYCALAKPHDDEIELDADSNLSRSASRSTTKARLRVFVLLVTVVSVVCIAMIALIAKTGHHHGHDDHDGGNED